MAHLPSPSYDRKIKKSSPEAKKAQFSRSFVTSFLSIAAFVGAVFAISAFSGPPAGCTPASCPANPLHIDFTNSRVGIGTATPSTKLDVGGDFQASGSVKGSSLCIGTDCKTAWPSAGAVAGAGQYQIGNMVWSGEQGNKNYADAMTACANLAPAGSWYLPTIADWDKAKGIKGGAAGLTAALGLSVNYYRTSSLTNVNYAYVYYAPSGDWNNYYNYLGVGTYNYLNLPLPVRCLQNS